MMGKDVILRILLAMTNNKEFFAQSFITTGKLIKCDLSSRSKLLIKYKQCISMINLYQLNSSSCQNAPFIVSASFFPQYSFSFEQQFSLLALPGEPCSDHGFPWPGVRDVKLDLAPALGKSKAPLC